MRFEFRCVPLMQMRSMVVALSVFCCGCIFTSSSCYVRNICDLDYSKLTRTLRHFDFKIVHDIQLYGMHILKFCDQIVRLVLDCNLRSFAARCRCIVIHFENEFHWGRLNGFQNQINWRSASVSDDPFAYINVNSRFSTGDSSAIIVPSASEREADRVASKDGRFTLKLDSHGRVFFQPKSIISGQPATATSLFLRRAIRSPRSIHANRCLDYANVLPDARRGW